MSGKPFRGCDECFADGCSEWPLQLVLHGVVVPALGAVFLIISLATLKHISSTNALHDLASTGTRKATSATPKTPDQVAVEAAQAKEQENRQNKKRLVLSLRVFVRVLCVYFSGHVIDFLRPNAGIFRYQRKTGYILCYISLYEFLISRSVLTFLETYASMTLLEIFIVSSLLSRRKAAETGTKTDLYRASFFKERRYRSKFAAPPLHISGTPFFTAAVGLFSIIASLVCSTSYKCLTCDLSSANEVYIERLDTSDHSDPLFILDTVFLSIMIFESAILIGVSVAGLCLVCSLARAYVPPKYYSLFYAAFGWSMLALLVLGVHEGTHFVGDLATRFGAGHGSRVESDCLFSGLLGKHCPVDDYIYIAEQVLLGVSLLKLIDILQRREAEALKKFTKP